MGEGEDAPNMEKGATTVALPPSAAGEDEDDEPADMFEIDEIEISDREAEDIDVNHQRLKKISKLETLPNAKTLCLRNNLIKVIENLEPLADKLLELDLYDNQLTKHERQMAISKSEARELLRIRKMMDVVTLPADKVRSTVVINKPPMTMIENLEKMHLLTVLDLSYNRIKVIENLTPLTNLTKLFLVNNKISKIENLETLSNLTMLELGANKIRKMENLGTFPKLEQLYLGKNKITKLEGLENMPNLRILSVQSNRITKLEGLENLVNLEELYISSNGISKIENLEKLTKLQTLDLAFNRITHLENLEALTNMEEFWFNDNRVAEWDQLNALVPLKSLQTLYMERNPLYYTADGKKDSAYRRKILLLLPGLRQLDATLTGVGLRTG